MKPEQGISLFSLVDFKVSCCLACWVIFFVSDHRMNRVLVAQVLKVYDHKSQSHVALKIVRNEKRFHRQAAEEIRILEHLRKQDKVRCYSCRYTLTDSSLCFMNFCRLPVNGESLLGARWGGNKNTSFEAAFFPAKWFLAEKYASDNGVVRFFRVAVSSVVLQATAKLHVFHPLHRFRMKLCFVTMHCCTPKRKSCRAP